MPLISMCQITFWYFYHFSNMLNILLNTTCFVIFIFVHDSYLCKMYKSENWRPFPTQRLKGEYNFVGAAGPMEINSTCPEECRPLEHKDWRMC